jgi:signal transduction histidine kinase
VPAIRAATQVFQRRNPAIETALTIEGDVPRLRPEYDTLIYRIVQEALTNVVKHAQADRVEIQIAVDGEELTVEVIDNGKGFDAERMSGVGAAGWGLLGIRERTQLLGGEARFRSAPGAGTRISVRIPLGDARQSPAQEPIQESRNVQRA